MRAVEVILGGAIVLVLVLGVAAVLTDGTGPPGDGDDGVVDRTEPEDRDAGGQPDDRDVVEQPDEPDTEGTPGSEDAAAPEPPEDGAEPGAGEPPGADTAPGEDSRVALDEPSAGERDAPDPSAQQPGGADPSAQQPGGADPSRTLPNTGGAVPAGIGLALLALAGVVGLVRIHVSR